MLKGQAVKVLKNMSDVDVSWLDFHSMMFNVNGQGSHRFMCLKLVFSKPY